MRHRSRYGCRFWLQFGLGALLVLVAATAQARQEVLVSDIQVIDGDTLTCIYRGNRVTVDFRHIDAPELPQPFGKVARDFLIERLGKSPSVWLDVGLQDTHQKSFSALVYGENSQCINFELLKRGLAWYVGEREATSEFYYIYEQEKHARTARLGLWSQPAPEPPWIWLARQPPPAPPRPTLRPAVVTQKSPPPSFPAAALQPETKPASQPVATAAVTGANTAPYRVRTDNTVVAAETARRPEPLPETAPRALSSSLESAGMTSLPTVTSKAVSSTPVTDLLPARSRLATVAAVLFLSAGLLAFVLVLSLTRIPMRLRCGLRVRALERKIGSPRLLPFALVGAVVNAENGFKDEALEAIDRFCTYLELSEKDRTEALHIVRNSHLDLSTLKCLSLRCLALHGSDPDLIDAMLLVCFVAATADGTFSAEEQLYLYLLCATCGGDFDKYADKFIPAGGNDALATLGLVAPPGHAELRSKISRLHVRYRPSALRQQGLTEAELAFALDRYREIEEASALLLADI